MATTAPATTARSARRIEEIENPHPRTGSRTRSLTTTTRRWSGIVEVGIVPENTHYDGLDDFAGPGGWDEGAAMPRSALAGCRMGRGRLCDR